MIDGYGHMRFFNWFPAELMTADPVTPKMSKASVNEPEAIAPLASAIAPIPSALTSHTENVNAAKAGATHEIAMPVTTRPRHRAAVFPTWIDAATPTTQERARHVTSCPHGLAFVRMAQSGM